MALRLRWVNKDTQRVVEFEPDLVCAGLDFGFGHPLAFEVGAKVRNIWINIWERYETHMAIPEVLHLVRSATARFGLTRIWADPEDPKMIQYLQGWGLPVLPNLVKDLNYGLRTVYGLLKTNAHSSLLGYGPRFRVNRKECPNLINEFGRYAWPQSKGEVVATKPVDRHNDAVGAVRYYLVGEGEMPPEDTRAPLEEQPRMFLNDQGQWVDNPRAVMAQGAMAQQRANAWWDELDASLISGGRFVPDE